MADSDSLMALQALLKIRSDSIAEAEEASSVGTNKRPKIEQKAQRGNNKKTAKDGARPGLLVHPSKFNGQSMFKQQTPSMAPDGQALAPNFALKLQVQNTKPFALHSVQPVVTPSATLKQAPKATDNRKRPRKKALPEDSEHNDIRPDEVEAALRSKPQRGRKRDNLSALERLELTRTRNREHAKSTRIRKKARYQELLDNERKYQELNARDELLKKRHESIQSFLSIRESMVRTCLDRSETLPSKETSVDAPKPSGLVSPHRMVTFSESMTNRMQSCDRTTGDSDALRLDQVVECPAGFQFTTVNSTTDSCEHGPPRQSALSAMAQFDCSLATKVQETMGKKFVGSLSFKLAEVAVNTNGTGFAEVLVVARGTVVLMTLVLKLQFAQDSSKLKSVACFIMKEHTADDSLSSSSLGCQISHPSVVSLDPEACGEKLRAVDGDPEIGIDI